MKELAFSIPIYKYKIENWEARKEKIINLYNSLEMMLTGNLFSSTPHIKTDLFDTEKEMFEIDCGHKLLITNCWFQKYDHNMDHMAHTHGPYGFSSICFVEYDKSIHKPTTFISPFTDCIKGEIGSYEPNVDEGDIIFFPSNLMHYAPVNTSNKRRIILSFNLRIDFENMIQKNNLSIVKYQ